MQSLQAFFTSCASPLLPVHAVVFMFVQALLSRGVQHSSPLVQHATLVLLHHMLQAMQPLFATAVAQASAPPVPDSHSTSHAQSIKQAWVGFVRELRTAVRGKLPDPSTLLALHAALLRSTPAADAPATASLSADAIDGDHVGADANDSPEVLVKLELMQPLVLEVLAGYQRLLPEAMADAHVDVGKLVPQVRWCRADSCSSHWLRLLCVARAACWFVKHLLAAKCRCAQAFHGRMCLCAASWHTNLQAARILDSVQA